MSVGPARTGQRATVAPGRPPPPPAARRPHPSRWRRLLVCIFFVLVIARPLHKTSTKTIITQENRKSCSMCITFGVFVIFLSATASFASLSGIGTKEIEGGMSDLYPKLLRDQAVARLNELGKVSDDDAYLVRTFMSAASLRAGRLVRGWMEDAGLTTWVDFMGNVHGRIGGLDETAEALLIGSHLDTVVDAGIFDGSLGIISALSALGVLKSEGMLEKLLRPVEVIAFSDEEGVRFQSTFLGSSAVAGVLPVSALQILDKSGASLESVLKKNSNETMEESFLQLKRNPMSVWSYIEVHIEQGPVLEQLGLPLGVVGGIVGQTRLKVTVRGSQGHAGTVPMALRQDPMAAAAELILLLESLCQNPKDYLTHEDQCNNHLIESLSSYLVCTVGEISVWPNSSNVIPGQVTYTIDLRALDDMGREAVLLELYDQMHRICKMRSVSCTIERKHDANSVMCDSELSLKLRHAVNATVQRLAGGIRDVPVLVSGAGHDAMAMSRLTKSNCSCQMTDSHFLAVNQRYGGPDGGCLCQFVQQHLYITGGDGVHAVPWRCEPLF